MEAQMELVRLDAKGLGKSNRGWVQLARATGGVAKNGDKQFEITREDIAAYAASIRANPDRIPVDYDHSFGTRGDSRAAGWVDSSTVEVRNGDELWAQVDWTPEAAQSIRSGAYRFFSPEVRFKERKDGVLRKAAEFVAGALTNRPFFKDMAAVRLSESSASALELRAERESETAAVMARADQVIANMRSLQAAEEARSAEAPARTPRLTAMFNGVETPIDRDSAELDARAQAWLSEQGVSFAEADAAQYLAAVDAVRDEPAEQRLSTQIDGRVIEADEASFQLDLRVKARLAECGLGPDGKRPVTQEDYLRATQEVLASYSPDADPLVIAAQEEAQAATELSVQQEVEREAAIAQRADALVLEWRKARGGMHVSSAERAEEYMNAVELATADVEQRLAQRDAILRRAQEIVAAARRARGGQTGSPAEQHQEHLGAVKQAESELGYQLNSGAGASS